jgi:hypothetical protein
MPRKAEVEDGDKKNRLTLAQLAAYDDVSTDVMIDQVSTFAHNALVKLTGSRHTGSISEKLSEKTEATSTSPCAYRMKQSQRSYFTSSLREKTWLGQRSLYSACLV